MTSQRQSAREVLARAGGGEDEAERGDSRTFWQLVAVGEHGGPAELLHTRRHAPVDAAEVTLPPAAPLVGHVLELGVDHVTLAAVEVEAPQCGGRGGARGVQGPHGGGVARVEVSGGSQRSNKDG